MRFTFSIGLLIILFACKKEKIGNVQVFGHAGMGLSMQNSIYHDNSFEAVHLCLAMPNSNGVEVDVQMDKEGNLWLFHDQFLDAESSLDGCVNDKSSSELGSGTYKTLKKEKIVRLSQIINEIGSGQKLFLDIKNANACKNSIVEINLFRESLNNLIDSVNPNIYLILNDVNWLSQLSNQFQVLFSSDDLVLADEVINQNAEVKGLVVRNKTIDKNKVNELKNQGKEVYLFDIRSPKGNREAMLKEPNGIITDDIRAALIERN
jgi:glycerophosphoryl diester phosphodiesterase